MRMADAWVKLINEKIGYKSEGERNFGFSVAQVIGRDVAEPTPA